MSEVQDTLLLVQHSATTPIHINNQKEASRRSVSLTVRLRRLWD